MHVFVRCIAQKVGLKHVVNVMKDVSARRNDDVKTMNGSGNWNVVVCKKNDVNVVIEVPP